MHIWGQIKKLFVSRPTELHPPRSSPTYWGGGTLTDSSSLSACIFNCAKLILWRLKAPMKQTRRLGSRLPQISGDVKGGTSAPRARHGWIAPPVCGSPPSLIKAQLLALMGRARACHVGVSPVGSRHRRTGCRSICRGGWSSNGREATNFFTCPQISMETGFLRGCLISVKCLKSME